MALIIGPRQLDCRLSQLSGDEAGQTLHPDSALKTRGDFSGGSWVQLYTETSSRWARGLHSPSPCHGYASCYMMMLELCTVTEARRAKYARGTAREGSGGVMLPHVLVSRQ